MRPERTDLRPERMDLRPERPDLRPEKPGQGGTNRWANERTNNQTNKSPPVFYRASSPSGPLPYFLSHQFTIMESRAMGIADHI